MARRRPPEPPGLARAEELLATGCPPLPPISGFVGRQDGQLLLDGVTAFRSTGTNLYYLQQLLSYAQQEQDPQALDAVREVLDDLVCLSLPVARIWGFNDSKDTSSIRRSPAEGFREEGLRGLDQAVWEAKRRGIRLILPLVNNWAEYGGIPAYAAWASELYGSPVTHDDFFRDAQMKQWWKDYASMLVDRVNTFTGVRYRDEPAILAWEIGNEMRCASCAGTTALPDTVAELAGFLKQIAPNQLIADGGDGFDDDPDPYIGLTNYYAVRGDDGCSFSRLARIDALDMLSYHFYPRDYGFSTPRDAELWIERTPGPGDGDRQGRLPGRVWLCGARRRARPELRRLAPPPVRAVRRAAGPVLAAVARRPREQRRLRRLFTPRRRHGLDPGPLGQGDPLANASRPAQGGGVVIRRCDGESPTDRSPAGSWRR